MGMTGLDGERRILRCPLAGRAGRPMPFIPAAKFTPEAALPYNSRHEDINGNRQKMNRRSHSYVLAGVLVPALLGTLALSSAEPNPQQDQTTLRVDVDLVNVLCTVQTRQGRFVTDLKRQDFRIEEDGVTQSVTHFAREVTLPLTLGILIDTSPSVQDILPLEQRAAIEF